MLFVGGLEIKSIRRPKKQIPHMILLPGGNTPFLTFGTLFPGHVSEFKILRSYSIVWVIIFNLCF